MATTGLWKPLVSEPKPDDLIVDAPSFVTPLLSKTKENESQIETNADNKDDDDDEVQIIGQQGSNLRSPEDYVKASYVAALTKRTDHNPILTLKNYYASSAGELLFDIGLRRVIERDLEITARKIAIRLKKTDDAELDEKLASTRKMLIPYQESNKSFRTNSRYKCHRCRFTTEFKIVFEGHLEVPHISNRREYLCNWCEHKTKSADQIIAHFLYNHKRRCKIEKPLPIHLCRFCPYETNSKRSITSHSASCENFFPVDTIQSPKDFGENDFPGVTSKLIDQDDLKAYERTRNALLLSSYNPHQINISGPNEFREQRQVLLIPSRNLSQNINHVAPDTESVINDTIPIYNPLQHFAKSRQNNRQRKSLGFCNQSRLMSYMAAQNPSQVASPSVLQHPRVQSLYMNGRSALVYASGIMMAPTQQHPGNSGRVSGQSSDNSNQLSNDRNHYNDQSREGDNQDTSLGSGDGPRGNPTSTTKKSDFIICEICDSYTRDLTELRYHMVSIHELKINQKTLERRPPLSCQKCKWRFFTDQGLERHLLGVHSLVTSNVQNLVENGKDSGRCTVCGKAFANKLVAHMKDTHKANLKLAHLSYKCTICTATFNLYSLFENHVVSVHPDSIKKVTTVE